MERVKGRMNMRRASSSSSSFNSSTITQEEEGNIGDLRRGPWTLEEDLKLVNYIASHGEGRWNSLALCAGLKRTGKSCRLRWLNYLRPDVRRGNITLEEQLMILELHSQWGNRWSKIAQYMPGRTDNEIKNYWRTRVQKHAKQLKCDVNSKQFKDAMRYLWMPRLVERIQAAAAAAATSSSTSTTSTNVVPPCGMMINGTSDHPVNNIGTVYENPIMTLEGVIKSDSDVGYTRDNSSTSDSLDTYVSGVTPDCFNNIAFNHCHNTGYDQYSGQVSHYGASINSQAGCFNQGFDFQPMDQHATQWFDAGEDNFWNNVDDTWFFQLQSNNI